MLTDCYLPAPKSAAQQMHDLGTALRALGQDVTILCSSDQTSESVQITEEEGLRVIRVRNKTKYKFRPLRALREMRISADLWRASSPVLSKERFDLLIFYSPTIFLGELVQRLKGLWGCGAYLVLRDIFPKWAVDVGLLRKGLIYRYFRKKEIEQYRAADMIGVESPASLEYFAREVPPGPYQVEVLYSWASSNHSHPPPASYRAALGLADKVVFVYAGNLGIAQDVNNLVRLAANTAGDPRIQFLVVGEGTEAAALQSGIAARQLKNIRTLAALSQQDCLAMLSEFDVGLVSLNRGLTTHNIPGKMFSYMLCSMPILASVNPVNDLIGLINRNHVGIGVANGEDSQLAAAAIRLAGDPDLRLTMGCNSRRLLESQFSATVAASQILRAFGVRPGVMSSQAQEAR